MQKYDSVKVTILSYLKGEGEDNVGSVSGGGRYDGLVNMFSPKSKVIKLTLNLIQNEIIKCQCAFFMCAPHLVFLLVHLHNTICDWA